MALGPHVAPKKAAKLEIDVFLDEEIFRNRWKNKYLRMML
jgi:hypothetical protein